MKKAIAMKCTQEQWDSIKDRLQGIYRNIDSFLERPYLVNNLWGDKDNISNLNEYEIKANSREIHETFNAKIFFDACGIETDVFEITKTDVIAKLLEEKTRL